MSYSEKLFDFIKASPTSRHAAAEVVRRLQVAGYSPLCEGKALVSGNGYYLHSGGAVIAFRHRAECKSFNITASHSDSPAFKLVAGKKAASPYTRLSVERYGGAINYTWLDRPLSVAGVAVTSEGNIIRERLVDLGRDLVTVPSVPPHLNRAINDGFAPNPAVDLQPLYAIGEGDILAELAAALSVRPEDIISHDLYLYSREEGRTLGASGELLLAPRIDDLASVYTALLAFLAAPDTEATPVLAVFDHEEVGSATAEGAASSLLNRVLAATCTDEAARREALCASLMLSVDGAHALHPNHPELFSPDCHPILGGGVAVKYNAERRYATDALSDALLRQIASDAKITLQNYANRADLRGGSTLGSIAATAIGIKTVDIGIPQLAMHSIAETAAISDVMDMERLLLAFYSAEISKCAEGYTVKL